MLWLVVPALVLVVLIALCLPVRFAATVDLCDRQGGLLVELRWSFLRLWQLRLVVTADNDVELKVSGRGRQQAGAGKTQTKSAPSEPAPAPAPGTKRSTDDKRSPGRKPRQGLEPAIIWQLVKKYWRAALGLLHWRVTGDLKLKLSDPALTGRLFGSTAVWGWPPPTVKLELVFGERDNLTGIFTVGCSVYPQEVLRLLWRVAWEPPIKSMILARIRKKRGSKIAGSESVG